MRKTAILEGQLRALRRACYNRQIERDTVVALLRELLDVMEPPRSQRATAVWTRALNYVRKPV